MALRLQVILNSFPAVCWIYGAGMIFSTFVSLVFWGATARRIYEYVRKMASIVRPLGLQASLRAVAYAAWQSCSAFLSKAFL